MNNTPVKLPEFQVEQVLAAFSETIDWGLIKNNIPETWKYTMGEGITVYVLDTGCSDHVDLAENSFCGGNFIRGEDPMDRQSFHSTHCGGIIGANSNGYGVVGVAPKCNIVFVKCLSNSGTGSEDAVANALRFCVEAKDGLQEHVPPPDVINMSLGASSPMPRVYSWIKELYKRNVPVVCAAGNERSGVSYPAKYPEAITIAAYDQNGKIANFSNYGPEVDFAAPGVNIYSTYGNNTYARISGTCLKGDTLVYTTNGPVQIKDLKVGDFVWSFNGKDFEPKKVLNAWSNGLKPIITVKDESGNKIECTENHPFLCDSGEYVWAKDLKISQKIVTASEFPSEKIVSRVESVDYDCGEDEVWDIEVEDNHNFIANGFVVHNSMASPFVAGIIALMLAKHKKQEAETGKNDCRTVENMRQHLIKYAVDAGKVGKDKDFGFGIIDIHKLIAEMKMENEPTIVEPEPKPIEPTPVEPTPIKPPEPPQKIEPINPPKKISFWEWLKKFFRIG